MLVLSHIGYQPLQAAESGKTPLTRFPYQKNGYSYREPCSTWTETERSSSIKCVSVIPHHYPLLQFKDKLCQLKPPPPTPSNLHHGDRGAQPLPGRTLRCITLFMELLFPAPPWPWQQEKTSGDLWRKRLQLKLSHTADAAHINWLRDFSCKHCHFSFFRITSYSWGNDYRCVHYSIPIKTSIWRRGHR